MRRFLPIANASVGRPLPRGAAAVAGLAQLLRHGFQAIRPLNGTTLKMQTFFRTLARVFTLIPAEFAGSRVRLCRAEG